MQATKVNEDIVSLYGDKVKLRYRDVGHAYARSIDGGDWKEVTGVTTIINKTLHKEGLALWPMWEALGYLKEAFAMPLSTEHDLVVNRKMLEPLFEEASKAHTRKSDKGKDVGTEVHEAIEKFLMWQVSSPKSAFELTNPVSSECRKAFESFRKWFRQVNPKVLATEQLIYSLEYDYAGRFDALLEIDGKVILTDIKTSNKSRTAPLGIYDNNFVQLGGYSLAYQEEKGKAIVVDGKIEPIPPRDSIIRYERTVPYLIDLIKIDDLMVINVGKDGTLNTLSASNLGLSVEFCEDAFRGTVELYNFLNPLQRQLKERIK